MDAEPITSRETALQLARRYADKAALFAGSAEIANGHNSSTRQQVPGIATVGTLYADIARSYAAIAQAAPAANTAEEN